MSKITGTEYPLKKIFSNEFDFSIPPYQRPYAWTEEQVGELMDDLVDFRRNQDGGEPYFLGSIVLIKTENEPPSQVIDGQQRLTTLTILLAAIASRLRGDDSQDFWGYVNEPGKKSQGLEAKPRLTLRPRDAEFFRHFVQQARFDELAAFDLGQLTDVQKNIRLNSGLIFSKLSNEFGTDRAKLFGFGSFLVNNCYLVAVSTPTMESAYRIFSVLNDRGLDLLTCDILKADFIGRIAASTRDDYTTKWEDVEQELGRDNFNNLFGHIRMIYQKEKARKTVLQEFREHVLTKETDPVAFVDHQLVPYAQAYQDILTTSYQSSSEAGAINGLLGWLNRIEDTDWVPPLLRFMRDYANDPTKLLAFLSRLERLAGTMHVRGLYSNDRISRYAKVLSAIEDGSWDAADSTLELADTEKKATVDVLSGDIYNMSKRPRTYLLLRLDSFLSDRAAVYDQQRMTVEHVLPQKVSGEGAKYWDEHWPDVDEREGWMHRLGNLVLLSRNKNSQAQNYDFATKKKEYFSSKGGVSSYVITSKVLAESEWTPRVVDRLQGELLATLKKGWGLGA